MFYVINLKSIKKLLFNISFFLLILFVIIWGVKIYFPVKYVDIINDKSKKYNLEPSFVCAIIRTESRFRTHIVSNKGATGLMQIMEPTAVWVAGQVGIKDFDYTNITNADINIEIGCAYINGLIGKYGNVNTALCAYNAGSGNVDKWLKDKNYSDDGKTLKHIPYKETREYVQKVNTYKKIYNFILMFNGGRN